MKPEVIVICWKEVDCFLWVGNELLPQVKYLRVLFMNEEEMKHEVDRQTDVALYQITAVKKKKWRLKLSVYH